MIQRIQTVYLLIGALLMAGFFAFERVWYEWTVPAGDAIPWVLMVWGGVTALLGLVSILLYKTRERQRRIVVIVQWLTIVFITGLIGILFVVNRLAAVLAGQVPVVDIVAVFFPVAAYIFFYLARRGIEHDIEKVRSVDRLR